MKMRWERVCLEAITYNLPEERQPTAELEQQLEPVYRALHVPMGQVEAMTGITERRLWPRGTSMASVAAEAGRRALHKAGLHVREIGAVIYGGVCRDNLEPATACAVADYLGVGANAVVHDVSNACLGVLTAMVEVANRIELGQIKAGLVVSAESAREIGEATIRRLLSSPSMDAFRLSVATLTGGSGAVGVVLMDKDLAQRKHRLVGATALSAPEHHTICRWGPSRGLLGETANVMVTDASKVLSQGVELGRRTFERFLRDMAWERRELDRVICHQVGSQHQRQVLKAFELPPERGFTSFELLGNMGSVALPLTVALAEEAGALLPGNKVGLLGIGSGLNCLMMGVEW